MLREREPETPPDWRRAPALTAMAFDRAFGAAVHRALRTWQGEVDAGAAPVSESLLAAVRREAAGLGADHRERGLARIAPHLVAYARGPWPRRRTLALERSATVRIDGAGLNLDLTVRIDRAVALDGGAAILDFKTVSPHAAQRARDRWQLRAYALAGSALGLPPAGRLRLVILDILAGRAVDVGAAPALVAGARARLLREAAGILAADFRVGGHPDRPCWSCGFRLACPRSLSPS